MVIYHASFIYEDTIGIFLLPYIEHLFIYIYL